jgi:GNAT superfamily N-acetyltransferase
VIYPFSDVSLARRLERAEAEASAQFVEARSRVEPGSAAAWIDVAGTYAMFDGVASPITQTFGFGLFAPPSVERLVELEQFFRDRGAPVFHEVSPLADPAHAVLLAERGYRPFEFTSVMYRPIETHEPAPASRAAIGVRVIEERADQDVWSTTAADGWGEQPELREFILGIARVYADRPDTRLFLAEHEGRAIATGVLILSHGVALLAGASTIPEGRGRGAQLALLASRLSYAVDHGYDLAMMSALPGSGSQRNAERHGFRIAYTRTKWRLTENASGTERENAS